MDNIEKVKVGSDFSGVGAFNQALIRLGVNYDEVFACDMDKYARKTFIHNYGEPKYYPKNVYDREIPTQPLDIYMTSPPCQSFSLAGKRKGEDDDRGVLFYNSHEFIKKNKPRYFIFENVKGLISDENGKTFQRWIDFLGGKSVNGTLTMFPHEESVPYHVYYKVLNAKDYGVPQNRERIFIIGIRDDADNYFTFPKPFPLIKRLKDILEENVDEKYYLSENMVDRYVRKKSDNKNNFCISDVTNMDISPTLISGGTSPKDKQPIIKVGYINQDIQSSQVFSQESVYQTLCAGTHGYANGYVQIFDTPKVKFQLTGGKWDKTHEQSGRVYDENGIAPTIHTMGGGNQEPKVDIGAIRGLNPDNPKSRESGLPTQQMLEINEKGYSNALTTVQKDNVVIEQRARGYNKGNTFELSPSITCNSWQENNFLIEPIIQRIGNYSKSNHNASSIVDKRGISPTVMENHGTITAVNTFDYRIRKLTPRECFRLMDFPDTFDFSVVSDSQAYKQAGNSIVVNVLTQIISKLK